MIFRLSICVWGLLLSVLLLGTVQADVSDKLDDIEAGDAQTRRDAIRYAANNPLQFYEYVNAGDSDARLDKLGYLLASGDEETRYLASVLLSQFVALSGSEITRGTLLSSKLKGNVKTLVSDNSARVRESVIGYVFVVLGNGEAVQEMLVEQWMNEGDDDVREVIVEALALSGLEEPVESVRRLIVDEGLGNRNPVIAGFSARSIATMRDPPEEALPILAQIINESDELFMLNSAVFAVSNYGDSATPYLESIKASIREVSDGHVRKQLLDALNRKSNDLRGLDSEKRKQAISESAGQDGQESPNESRRSVPGKNEKHVYIAVFALIVFLLVVGALFWSKKRRGD